MWSGLRIISRFLLHGSFFVPSPDPDKTTARVTRPYQYIPSLVQDRSCSYSLRQLVDIIEDNGQMDPQRADTLRECRVDEVSHFRRDYMSGKGPHEIVVIRYSHAVIEENGASIRGDCRIARFERLAPGSATTLAPPPDSATVDLDHVRIAEFIEDLAYNYTCVARFVPERDTLNIVDCAVAAHIISERSRAYTLQCPSLWYADALFHNLRCLSGSPPVHVGSARIRDRASQTNAGPSVIQLQEMQAAIKAKLDSTWQAIRKATEYAYERVHREEILKREAASRAAEMERLRAQLAEARRIHRSAEVQAI
ncbi:hypothetical protein BD626DRAFT_492888 [Schizophyllum amplum]|uniref:Uncharacterized protein n=1 Tax=Schizophyllum amplum TaxID=97359 RepID=A0A550CGD2_9AGAR|nr:hypothetical protein BD626DRAFT_492888 [Auriculariopsis ampla]